MNKPTLKYIINTILAIFCFSNLWAQESKIVNDSIKPSAPYNPKTYGLRIGIDIIRPILAITEELKGLEVVGDWRINTRLFVASELGYMNRSLTEDNFKNTISGSYLKAGINYNLYTNWLQMDNEVYLGARYGFSAFNNKLDHYTIFQEGEYFEIREVNTPKTYEGLYAHWFEFVAGLKVEVIPNIYMGFMMSVNKLISTNDPDNFENNYSPGFGNISSNSGAGFNLNYTISYRIPLYKK